MAPWLLGLGSLTRPRTASWTTPKLQKCNENFRHPAFLLDNPKTKLYGGVFNNILLQALKEELEVTASGLTDAMWDDINDDELQVMFSIQAGY